MMHSRMTGSEELRAAAERLHHAKRVLVLTGAGISAESGITPFRSEGGLWERYPPKRYATWSGLLGALLLQPRHLVRFASEVLGPIARARPNPAHLAIAELERRVHLTVVTQNVDGLHQEAGSTGVRQIHGSMFEIADRHGRILRRLSRADMGDIARKLGLAAQGPLALARASLALRPLAGMSSGGPYLPNIVLFGDKLRQPDWDDAQRCADQCDLVVIVGTSGMVMPAAALPDQARSHGANVIVVDPTPQSRADVHLRGRAAELMPALVALAADFRASLAPDPERPPPGARAARIP